MASRMTTFVVAGALGITALTATVAVPALAETVSGESTASEAVGNRVNSIRDALQGLVDNKTITDAQADKVADTLGRSEAWGPGRHGGPGHHRRFVVGGREGMEAVAKVLGMTPDAVRTALRDGTTLSELAQKQGKSKDAVVSALVTSAKAKLAEAVKEGRLTQERADEFSASLESRIRQFVDEGRPARGDGPGREWRGRGGPWGGPGGSPEERPAPATPSPSTSTSTSTSAQSSSLNT